MVNLIQVEKFLGGLDYPVGKDQIIEHARAKGADENIIEALERLPDRDYEDSMDISNEMGKMSEMEDMDEDIE